MSTDGAQDPSYVMGRSDAETQRLADRAEFFYPSTRTSLNKPESPLE
jgi:hypothetical protein